MKVVFAAPGFSSARSRRQPWVYIDRVARGLTERGFELTVATDRDQPVADDPEVPFRVEVSPHLSGARGWLRGLPKRVIRDLDPTDILVSFVGWLNVGYGMHSPITPLHVAALTSPPFNNGDWKNLLQEGEGPVGRIHLLASKLSMQTLWPDRLFAYDGVVATSLPTYAYLTSRLDGDRVLNAPSGVERELLGFARGEPTSRLDGDPLITYCGPPRRSRGLRIFFEALRTLQTHRPDMKAQFLLRPDSDGDDRQVRWLMQHLPELPSPERVLVEKSALSRAEFVWSLLASSLCVFPFQYPVSLTPISLLEAVALGVPTVVTPVGDLPQVAGGAGGTIAQGIGPGEVAEAIVEGLGRVEEGSRPPTAKPPTWDEIAVRWADFLQSLAPR